MRLWPLSIIDQLPRQQLLGQHRECCALRGKGWGRKHATVDYVFKHPYCWLAIYHFMVMAELQERGYHIDSIWYDAEYRGKAIGIDTSYFTKSTIVEDRNHEDFRTWRYQIYPEHDERYLEECIENLSRKGVEINRVKAKAKEVENESRD